MSFKNLIQDKYFNNENNENNKNNENNENLDKYEINTYLSDNSYSNYDWSDHSNRNSDSSDSSNVYSYKSDSDSNINKKSNSSESNSSESIYPNSDSADSINYDSDSINYDSESKSNNNLINSEYNHILYNEHTPKLCIITKLYRSIKNKLKKNKKIKGNNNTNPDIHYEYTINELVSEVK